VYHIPMDWIHMAPPKGKKGALEEQVRDVLIMTHFLVKGNSPVYAEQIRRSWDRHFDGNIIKWLPKEVGPRQKSLSLAGTIQICERLSAPERGILQRHTTAFGERRTVVTYTLSETPEGFGKVARTMLGVSPFLFLRSTYARNCLDNVWIPEIMRRLGRVPVRSSGIDWVIKHSPTALMISLEKDFGARSQEDWMSGDFNHGELTGWAGACMVADLMSPHRSIMFGGGDKYMSFNVRTNIDGIRDATLEGGGRIRLRRSSRQEGGNRLQTEEASL